MASIRSALVYSTLAGYGQRLLNLISVVLVSRLLSPEEIGIYAMAASIALIASEFKSVGAGVYLVRQQKLDAKIVRSACGLMSLICWSAGAILFCSAPSVALFYDVPDVKGLIWLSCISFLVAPTMSVIHALLARDYQFKKIFFIVLVSRSTNVALSVAFILQGYSYFGLGMAAALAALAEFTMSWLLKPDGLNLKPAFNGLKPIATFGLFVTLSNFCRKFTLVLPDILIGKRGTAVDVAIFSRGVGFLDFLFNSLQQGVAGVALPYLSEQKRQGHSLQVAYLYGIELLGVVVWPVLVVAGVAARPAILAFFGDQWEAAAALVSPLCMWMVLRSLHAFAPQLLITVGKERLLFYKEFLIFALSAICVWVFYPQGLSKIAEMLVCVGLIDYLVITLLLKLVLNFSALDFLRALSKNVFIMVVCGLVAMSVDRWVEFDLVEPLTALAVLAPVMILVWCGLLVVCRHPLLSELFKLFPIKRFQRGARQL